MRSFVSAMRSGKSKARREQREAQKTRAAQAQAVQNKGSVEATAKRLQARVDLLEGQQLALTKEAKVLAAKGNKQAALGKLRKKKMLTKETDKLRGAIFNLEQQAFAVECAVDSQEVIAGLRVGRNALNDVYRKIDVDEIHDLHDDVAESMQTMEEVDNLLAEPLGGLDYDEDDLAAELAELDMDDDIVDALPAVPTAPVAQPAPLAKPAPRIPPRPAASVPVRNVALA